MPTSPTSRPLFILLALCALLSSPACSVQRAHTLPFDGSDPANNKGVVYSIPKTYLSLSLTYTYIKDDLRPTQPQAHLAAISDDQPEPAIKITTLTAPDAKSTFIIKTDELLSNVLFLSSINFKFANGTLASVDASSVDRTGEILEQLGTTAVNLAKAAAKGTTTPDPHEQAIRAAEIRIDQIYTEIAKASAAPLDPDKPSKTLDNLETELTTMRKLIKDLRSNLDPPVRTLTAIYPVLIDPDSPSKTTPDYLEYEIKPPQLFADVPQDNMDILTLRIYDDHRRQFIHALQSGSNQPRDIPGILYRQPVRLLTKVFLNPGDDPDPTQLFSGMIPYLQFAPPAVAALDSKVLTAKHTTLVLDPVNGGLISYGIAQDSALERVTQGAADVSADAAHDDKSDNNKNNKSKSTSKSSNSNSTTSSSKSSPATPTKSLIEIPAILDTTPDPSTPSN